MPESATDGDMQQAIAHAVHEHNPIGLGFAEEWYLRATKATRVPVPQIQARNEPPLRFGEACMPVGLGIVGRAWQPRLRLAGTYDQQWLEGRHPGLPADFDFAYWNAAPADQQVIPHLDGDETITLSNLSPEAAATARDAAGNTLLSFVLPGHLPFVLVRFEDGRISTTYSSENQLIEIGLSRHCTDARLGNIQIFSPPKRSRLADTELEGVDVFHVIARSAFGELYVCGEKTGSSVSMNCVLHSVSAFENELKPKSKEDLDFSIRSLFACLEPDQFDLKDEDGQPLFERARSKLGPLEPHEIYGFQPAIVLGGSFLLENLVKVKANVHLTLLRMFGEPTFPFSGTDIEEWLDESDTQ